MAEFEEDYYATLGLDETASTEDIRKAYLKLAKKLHPDRFPNDEQGKAAAQSEFRRVTQAQYVLGDAERKDEYDNLRQLAKVRQAVKTGNGHTAGASSGTTTPDAVAENINKKWAGKHFSRADDLYRRRKFQEAETAIKEAIRLVPNDPDYHNKLAEIYLARGWKTYAMTEIQAALRFDPKNADAKNLEHKIRAMNRDLSGDGGVAKKGFLDQLKEMLNKKI